MTAEEADAESREHENDPDRALDGNNEERVECNGTANDVRHPFRSLALLRVNRLVDAVSCCPRLNYAPPVR